MLNANGTYYRWLNSVFCLDVLSGAMISTVTKSRESPFHLKNLEAGAEAMEEHCLLACFHGLLSWLFHNTAVCVYVCVCVCVCTHTDCVYTYLCPGPLWKAIMQRYQHHQCPFPFSSYISFHLSEKSMLWSRSILNIHDGTYVADTYCIPGNSLITGDTRPVTYSL